MLVDSLKIRGVREDSLFDCSVETYVNVFDPRAVRANDVMVVCGIQCNLEMCMTVPELDLSYYSRCNKGLKCTV